MAIDEIERTAMVQQLIDTLGPEPASTLMKCVLPDGVDRVVTKDDLYAAEDRLRADSVMLRAEFKADIAELTRTIVTQNRHHMLTMVGIMVSMWITLLAVGLG